MPISKKKALIVAFFIVTTLGTLVIGTYFLSHKASQDDDIIIDDYSDDDNDGLTNHDEIYVYQTDPNKTDTDDGGVTDLDEVLTYPHYGMDPNNPSDDKVLIGKVPNVVANEWKLENMTNDYSTEKMVNLSISDPLIKYLSEHSEIKWTDIGKNAGNFFVDGALIWGGRPTNREGLNNPSYYFTHGRKAACVDTCIATLSILKLMGYKATEVPMTHSETGIRHVAPAIILEDRVYIVNYGRIYTWDNFFEEEYAVDSDFDQNWYMND